MPGGPLQLMVGDQTFIATQRGVTFNKPELSQVGVLKKDITSLFHQDVIKGAARVNAMLQTASKEKDAYPAVNAFWCDLKQSDAVFLQIPIRTEGFNTADAIAILKMQSSEGNKFLAALHELDQPTMQELLSQILKIQANQKLTTSDICADHLVLIPQSATSIAQETLKTGVDTQTLYAQILDTMVIREISEHHPVESEPIVQKQTPPIAAIRESLIDPSHLNPEPNLKATLVETENEEELRIIANSISEPGVYGKFYDPVFVLGSKSSPRYEGDFENSLYKEEGIYMGSEAFNQVLRDEPTGRLSFFQSYLFDQRAIFGHDVCKIPDKLTVNSSITIAYLPDDHNQQLTKVGLFIPDKGVHWDKRSEGQPSLIEIFCTFPSEQFHRFMELVRDDPANAERFIQIAFGDGIDTMVRRKPVESVHLVDLEHFLPSQYTYTDGRKNASLRSTIQKKDYHDDTIETHHYPQPLPQFK
jgi:hypothetical protein